MKHCSKERLNQILLCRLTSARFTSANSMIGMPCYKCKRTAQRVHGVLQKHYCCQRCAATCVVGELKTQLLLAQEQNAGLVSKRGQDSACEPIEDSSLHEDATGAKSRFEMLYAASLANKTSRPSAVVEGTSAPSRRDSTSAELRHLIRRIPRMEATIIDHVLQAEELCQEMKGLYTLNVDYRKLDAWKYGSCSEATSAKSPSSRAIYITRMLRNTRDFCSSDIHFAIYAFSYLELK
jgi:hypothetical protein